MLTPAEVARKWQKNYSNAGEDFEAGVKNMTENPLEAAAANAEYWFARVRESYESQTWQDSLRSFDFQEWKNRTIKFGKLRMADGAAKGFQKQLNFMNFWLPLMQQLRQRIKAMPKASRADRRARMLAAFDFNSENKYKARGRARLGA